MADNDSTLKVLVQVQSDLSNLKKVVEGLEDLKKKTAETQKVTFGLAEAFKFAGAEEALRRIIDGIHEAGRKMVELTVDFVKESIAKASEIQAEQFPITQMLRGSGEVAKQVLGDLHSLWQQIGVVSNESLGKTAQALILIGTPAENLVARLTQLSKIAVGTGSDLEDLASGYQRLRQSITNETEPMIRGVGGFGKATLAMMQSLEDHFHKTAGEIDAMFKAGKINFADLNKALEESTQVGGRFFAAFEKYKNTYKGAVEQMSVAWQGFQFEMGKPMADALVPIIHKITDIERAFAKVAEEKGWQRVIQLAWALVMDQVRIDTSRILVTTFTNLGPALARAIWGGFALEIKELIEVAKSGNWQKILESLFRTVNPLSFAAEMNRKILTALIGTLPAEMAKDKAEMDRLLAAFYTPGETVLDQFRRFWATYKAAIAPTEEETHRANVAKQLAEALKELDGALARIRQEQTLINQEPFIGADEKQRLSLLKYNEEVKNLEKEITNLKGQKDVLPLNAPQIQEVNNKLQDAEFRLKQIRLQIAGLAQPFKKEMMDWAASFGTTAHQLATTLQNTLLATFQQFNQYVITGKFNVGQLLQQLILLSLQLMEQLAIQQIMSAFRTREAAKSSAEGVTIAASNAPGAAAKSVAQYGPIAGAALGVAAIGAIIAAVLGAFHEGGRISRRRRMHDGGEVPILAQEGEFMVRRSVVQKPGMLDYLERLNSYQTGGQITPSTTAWGGQDIVRFPMLPAVKGGSYIFPGIKVSRTGGAEWGGAGDGIVRFPMVSGGVPAQHTLGPAGTVGYWGTAIGLQSIYGGGGPTSIGALGGTWATHKPPSGIGYTYGAPALVKAFMGMPGATMAGHMIPGSWHAPGTVGSSTGPGGHAYRAGAVARTFASTHVPMRATQHAGGIIGGARFPRLHAGGGVNGGGINSGMINIYAFTDLKQLMRHMGSREGRKVIFDTVNGRRIDLGFPG
jgi:hypothetical protein